MKLFGLGIVVLGAAVAPSAADGSQYEIVRKLVLERFDTDRDGQLVTAEKSAGRHTFRSLFQTSGGFPIEIITVLDPLIVRVLEEFDQDNNQRLVAEEKIECRRVLYVLLFAPKRSSSRNRMGPVAKPSRERLRALVQNRRAIRANVGNLVIAGYYIGGSSNPAGSNVRATDEFDNGFGGSLDLDTDVAGIYQVDDNAFADTIDDALADPDPLEGRGPNPQFDYPRFYSPLRDHQLDTEWFADRLVPDPIAGHGYITREGEMFINFAREYFNDDYPDNPDWWRDPEWWRVYSLSTSERYRPRNSTDRQRRFLMAFRQVTKSMTKDLPPPEDHRFSSGQIVRHIPPNRELYKQLLEKVAQVLGVEIAVGDISREGDSEVSLEF